MTYNIESEQLKPNYVRLKRLCFAEFLTKKRVLSTLRYSFV